MLIGEMLKYLFGSQKIPEDTDRLCRNIGP